MDGPSPQTKARPHITLHCTWAAPSFHSRRGCHSHLRRRHGRRCDDGQLSAAAETFDLVSLLYPLIFAIGSNSCYPTSCVDLSDEDVLLLGFEQDLIHAIFKLVWRRRGHRRGGDSIFRFFFDRPFTFPLTSVLYIF